MNANFKNKTNCSRCVDTVDPWQTRATLLKAAGLGRAGLARPRREAGQEEEPTCVVGGAPPRLCKYVLVQSLETLNPKYFPHDGK